MLPGSRRTEQLSLHSHQRIVATVEDSVLRTEMTGLEFQEDDAPKRTHRRDGAWSTGLRKALFAHDHERPGPGHP